MSKTNYDLDNIKSVTMILPNLSNIDSILFLSDILSDSMINFITKIVTFNDGIKNSPLKINSQYVINFIHDNGSNNRSYWKIEFKNLFTSIMPSTKDEYISTHDILTVIDGSMQNGLYIQISH